MHKIVERLWPDSFVTENNLATLVPDLRSLLGDNAVIDNRLRSGKA